jgi:formylglycine-generating enzyme required for sulfatase activity
VVGRLQNPGTPTRFGYTFTGWWTDPACVEYQWDFANDRITIPDTVIAMDAMYLYAGWTATPYTVTFDAGSGVMNPASQTVTFGERVNRPVTPVNPGMSLIGWYKDPSFNDIWNFDTDTVTSTRTLYAEWEATTYIVRFHLGRPGGAEPHSVFIDASPVEQRVLAGRTATEVFMPSLPAGNTADWSFHGWYFSDEDPNEPAFQPGGINHDDFRATLQPWEFKDDIVSDNTDASDILNLYARWVPPVPDMVWVPRGSFIMGDSSVAGSPAAYHAYPTRRVTVDGFYMSRYQVTQIDGAPLTQTNRGYQQVMGVNPSQFTAQTVRPVERVSWFDALNYCFTLTQNRAGAENLTQVYTGFTPTSTTNITATVTSITNASFTVNWGANGYRLPTEAEWEFAARGGNGSPGNFMYAGSDTPGDVAWYNITVQAQPAGQQSTQIVGTKTPNQLGLYDMSGNVSEWVWDWFDSYKNIVNTNPGVEIYNNPKGPNSGTERVRRGGGWSNALGNVRSVVRNSDVPGTANWVIGFRVVRGPSEIW